ncbi:MAG: Response regulators consisting of a CheY-like receiver domain and a winged-helix DNA-binding domain [Phormidesmis priestleyi Ana]|uniref:Response regulators consisting of a CheY-like receiver domain and a winged-helix DNA-binding domain n=1 Tax=Phormidesmis priestleyi Ana TaxID=1666911 RepID=A0A0P8A115_9CYAN|nr:MAG: Response regulators consisting of a CheY-like receiver domain and a winged-helix DNA-binding domain [Phormidesmis priestleyi Ana]
MYQILIAEDESRISSFIEKGLKSHGFMTVVVSSGAEVLSQVSSSAFDLMLLDLGLPDKDGLKVIEELRGQGINFPIIILTARDEIDDKVAGLEGGADDYMTKPFRFEELLARIRLRLRSASDMATANDVALKVGDIVLDLRTRRAHVGSLSVDLPAREFTLAETFFRHPGQVLSREQLLDRVWGYDYNPGSNIVDVYVGYLRKKLGGDLIETVRGMGYRLRQ